jgi:hypothetical protein
MVDVSYERDIPEPRRRGLARVLRSMYKGGSIEIPPEKKSNIYSAARAAGVKVCVRTTEEGAVLVFRVDGAERPEQEDIFGQKIKKSILG